MEQILMELPTNVVRWGMFFVGMSIIALIYGTLRLYQSKEYNKILALQARSLHNMIRSRSLLFVALSDSDNHRDTSLLVARDRLKELVNDAKSYQDIEDPRLLMLHDQLVCCLRNDYALLQALVNIRKQNPSYNVSINLYKHINNNPQFTMLNQAVINFQDWVIPA